MLDKLKSMFVVTDEEDKKTTSEETSQEQKTEKEVVTSEVSNSTRTRNSSKGSVNNKIMEKLLQVIADNNQTGFDYIEFKNAIKALDKMPLDEKTKYRSAFATAQTIGVTVAKLLHSVDFYQKILANEDAEFNKVINHQLASKVGDKKQEVESFSKMIAEKKEQVKKLTEEIDKHQKHIDEVKSKILKDSATIEQTRKDFETTYYKLKYQINEDVTKIKDYLE